MANFEAFRKVISSSINLLFLNIVMYIIFKKFVTASAEKKSPQNHLYFVLLLFRLTLMIMMYTLEQLERMKCVIFTSCIGSKARNLWIRGFVFHLVCIFFHNFLFLFYSIVEKSKI